MERGEGKMDLEAFYKRRIVKAFYSRFFSRWGHIDFIRRKVKTSGNIVRLFPLVCSE